MRTRPGGIALIHFYEGAYGPTIRVAVDDLATVREFQSAFRELAADPNSSSSLADRVELSFRGMKGLTLSVRHKGDGLRGSLHRVDDGTAATDSAEFLWAIDPEEWETNAELLEPFLVNMRPGHQYLSDEHLDDALIEFAFKEGMRPLTGCHESADI